MAKDLKGKELGKGLRQRKDGRYEARAKINDISICLYGFNLKELKQQFEDATEQALHGADIKKNNITLNEWFEEWFTTYKLPVIKSTSVYPMKSKYYNTFGRIIGDMKVIDIKNINIQNVINILQSEERATSSMREALGRVRECLESAKNNKIISMNPCFEINVPWENKKVERRFLSEAEQNRFLKQVEFSWYKEMFYIMFLTGLRVGEVGGLRWSDIDFANKCINVTHSLSCNYENGVKKMMLTTPKTHNSYRSIPFMGECESMLLAQQKKVKKIKKELGSRFRCKDEYSDLVFVTTMGSQVLRYHAEKEVNNVVKAINEQEAFDSVREQRQPVIFEKVYPHAIRHTFCSRCFEKDMNPKVVQKIMGHQHYSTTIDIYTHVTDAKYDEEIAKFGNIGLPNEEQLIPNLKQVV